MDHIGTAGASEKQQQNKCEGWVLFFGGQISVFVAFHDKSSILQSYFRTQSK